MAKKKRQPKSRATKRNKKKPVPKTSSKSIKSFLGGVLLFFTAYIATSLFSYSPDDPSLFQTGNGPIKNLGGVLGAYAGELLLHIFGMSSFWVIIYCGINGFILLFNKISYPLIWSQTISLWILIVINSIFSSIFPDLYPYNNYWPDGPGGLIGNILSFQMSIFFGFFGSLILLVMIGLPAILALSRFSIIEYLDRKNFHRG